MGSLASSILSEEGGRIPCGTPSINEFVVIPPLVDEPLTLLRVRRSSESLSRTLEAMRINEGARIIEAERNEAF